MPLAGEGAACFESANMLVNSYEHLLLLSFWTFVKVKFGPCAIEKVNTDDSKLSSKLQK